MAATTSFKALIASRQRREASWRPPSILLALDPGGTTGWSIFKDGLLEEWGQIAAPFNDEAIFEQLILRKKPTQVVGEEYVLYPWKMKEQKWSDFPEPRLIGAIQFMCRRKKIPCVWQGANLAKGFCTDQKLRGWDYLKDPKHARDSIRHGCYFILFNNGKTGVASEGNSSVWTGDRRGLEPSK